MIPFDCDRCGHTVDPYIHGSTTKGHGIYILRVTCPHCNAKYKSINAGRLILQDTLFGEANDE